MKCPVDNETLVMADRNGVEIDYCPKCRGVWLDRGELDKIIERAAASAAPTPAPAPAAAPGYAPPPQPVAQHPAQGYRHDDDYRYKKKRKDFLSDLFDF
ncbi:MAG: hypothetical protein RIT14_1905 [Pseudomonadota bacterium]|jgi:Zn-finger nucleic acid-binding protein